MSVSAAGEGSAGVQPSVDAKAKSSFPRKQSRGPNAIRVKGTVPKNREEVVKWFGWGYKDSQFSLRDGKLTFTGNRYPICDQQIPFFLDFLKDKLGICVSGDMAMSDQTLPQENHYPESRLSPEVLNSFKELGIDISVKNIDRFVRSQGQSTDEIIKLKEKHLKRIPDAVIWPTCHEDVEQIVNLANHRDIVIIPFGGGTSVTAAVECPEDEQRPILSLDTSQMNEILWIDNESLVVCAEGGIVGQDLERELRKVGYTVGHEPDSIEFSTLGGWVSTRASGMKKNTYGNIEDLVVHARMVTPSGTLEKSSRAPRSSAGPDFNHVILGSEGSFGVITEVCIKLRPLPPFQLYGSLIFPDFESGVKCLREIARRRWQPASIRLLDHEQFQLGMALRGAATHLGAMLEGLKIAYVEKIKGFNKKMMCLTTLVYEGEKDSVLSHEKRLNAVAMKYGGIPAGSENGKRGYLMTFLVGYVRDMAAEFNVVTESFETAVPWDRVLETTRMVRQRLQREALQMGCLRSMVMFRVAQTYDAGCCLYIYYAITVPPNMTLSKTIKYIHRVIRTDLINKGAALTHHHGVGKLRREWYEKFVSPAGCGLLRAAKAQLDPKNIFAVNNLVSKWQTPECKL